MTHWKKLPKVYAKSLARLGDINPAPVKTRCLETGGINLGTSGIVLPGNKSTFPEEYRTSSRLHYYGSLFNSLEINSSFYKVPMAGTFAKWAAEVPDKFRFTVKLWKEITHVKHLRYSLEAIDSFMEAANFLGNKAGCLLVQFPASISFKYCSEVESLIKHLHDLNHNRQWHLAIEYRHKSWYQNYTYQMHEKYNAALVIHDMPNSQTPEDYLPHPLAYFRFHGPTGNYDGSYDDNFIQRYAEKIKKYNTGEREIYVYFNNTIGGALQNAQSLQHLLCLK